MPYFPNPSGGAPIQADSNPNPAGGSYGYYSAPGYSGPPPPTGGSSGGSSGGGGGGGGGSTPSNPTGPIGTNPQVDQMILSNLQGKALQEYYTAKLAMDSDQEAYQKAAQVIASELAQAGVTGTYQGQPTQQAIKQLADIAAQQASTMVSYAQQFGVWGTPTAGQQTLAAQQQGFSQAQQAAELTGWYTPYTYTPPTAVPGAVASGTATPGARELGPGRAAHPGQLRPGAYRPVAAGRGHGRRSGAADRAVRVGSGLRPERQCCLRHADAFHPRATGAATGAAGAANPQDQYIQARTAQLQQVASMGAQQAAQTAQSEWAQGYAQSGNVAYGMPTMPAATGAAGSAARLGAAAGLPNGGNTTYDPNNPAFSIQTNVQAMQGQPGYAAGGAGGATSVQTGQPGQPQAGTPPGAPPGWQPGQPIETLASQAQKQTTAQNYLTLLSGLRGPADYAKYNTVLGATPGGMKDLVAAAAGQYIPGGGATTGVAPTPVTLQNFVGSATGSQDPSAQAALNSLVAPNQMAPQTWNSLSPSQQQMLLGTWEAQGYNKDDAQALFNQSLPRYSANTPTSGSFKLQ